MENTKINQWMQELTFEEKCRLLTGAAALSTAGIERLGIPGVNLSDGPHGIRRLLNHPNKEIAQKCNIIGGDTCLPTASAIGASWNREIAFESGATIAKDCKEEDIQVLLAPGVNMKRTPHCGRNFEYFSEDPYLSGILGAEFIKGVQKEGVGTSLKHFAVNNQEIKRGTINAEVDERTLREYYLKVFEILLKHCNPTSVMCAYNKLNGIWCSENAYLLTELLKEEWGYDGLVVSDWGAVHNIAKSLKAGLDLQMPRNSCIQKELEEGLEKNMISEKDIDRAVRSVLQFIIKITEMAERHAAPEYDRKKQHEMAYKAACETITLLKNNGNILPIKKEICRKIAVLGRCAEDVLFMGGGSSKVTVQEENVDRPLEYIKKNAEGIQVDYFPIFQDGFYDEGVVHAIDAMKTDYDYVLLFVGDNYGMDCETESFDRDNLKLPNYVNAVIEKTASKFPNTVLILQSGGALLPYRWGNITAIIQMWYSGEAAGRAIADILFGKVNPSGKLSETFADQERVGLEYPGDERKCEYLEKWNCGYRYYDKHLDEVWFPFGHGLSYTEFAYSDIQISHDKINKDNFQIEVSCRIKNIGNMEGKEAVQLYVAPIDTVVSRPLKELRAFEKIDLKPREEKKVLFQLDQDAFAYFNLCEHNWHVESGRYDILIGSSSADIHLKKSLWVYYENDYTKEGMDKSMVI